MSGLLESELARLILGYFESRKCTKTVEMMLIELPELAEVAQRKKKGLKTNLRVGDLSLMHLIDDYFSSKNIIHESLEAYPSTFASVVKIQALTEQIKSIVDIAVRSKTYKFFPKNLYRSKHFMQANISQANEVEFRPANPQLSLETRNDIDATLESSLPGSFKRDSHAEDAESLPQEEFLEGREHLRASDTTPQKRKGLRKKGQPSPKLNPKAPKQTDADEKMEKLIKNLIENKELHTKIADSINNTLFSSKDFGHCRERVNLIPSNALNAVNRPTSVSQEEQFSTNSSRQQLSNCSSNHQSSQLKNNSLSDNIIRNLSDQVTNDPMIDSILAAIDQEASSSHRQLSTPVPILSPFHADISFSSSSFDILPDQSSVAQRGSRASNCSIKPQCYSNNSDLPAKSCAASDMILEECFSPSQINGNQNLTLAECFRNQDNANVVTKNLTVTERLEKTNVDLHKKSNNILGECFQNTNEREFQLETPNLTLSDCFSADVTQSFRAAGTQEEAQNLSLKKCFQNEGESQYNLKPLQDSSSSMFSRNNSDSESLNLEATKKLTALNDTQLTCEMNGDIPSCTTSSESRIVKKCVSFEREASRTDVLDSVYTSKETSLSNENSRDNGKDISESSEEPLDLTRLSSENVKNHQSSIMSYSSLISSDYNLVSHAGNATGEMVSMKDLCPKTPTLDYQMPPSLSPMRPPSVRAVPVAVSNDAFVNSKYFSGTPDHPTNYVITELTPLPPATPQEWSRPVTCGTDSTSNEGEPLVGSFITPSSPVIFPSEQNLRSIETIVSAESSGSKVIDIRINDDEETVIVQIPSSESHITTIVPEVPSVSPTIVTSEIPSLHPIIETPNAPHVSLENSVQEQKKKRKRKSRAETNAKETQLEGESVIPFIETEEVPRKGTKRKNTKSSTYEDHNLEEKSMTVSNKKRKISLKKQRSNSSSQLSTATVESKTGEAETGDGIKNVDHSQQWESRSDEVLSSIPIMSVMADLVDKLETNNVEDITASSEEIELHANNSTLLTEYANNVESHPSKPIMSPQISSLISFSKSFVLNSNTFSRSTKSPTSSERIQVYKGSLSTPRNKNSHIRVLDFNTPMKSLSSRKKYPRAKANLQFSPSPTSKKPKNMLKRFGKRIRTQSLTASPSVKLPHLQVILETSREEMDSSVAGDKSVNVKDKTDEDVPNREIEADLFLSEDETSSIVDPSDRLPLFNKPLSSMKKLKDVSSFCTPGKISPVYLEPTTPFIGTAVSDPQSDVTGMELNTPVPVIIENAAATQTPYIKQPQEPCSNDFEEPYYLPPEMSVSDSAPAPAPSQDDIESVLIRTAQISEMEMSKLKCLQKAHTCDVREDVDEYVGVGVGYEHGDVDDECGNVNDVSEDEGNECRNVDDISENVDKIGHQTEPNIKVVDEVRPNNKRRKMSNKELGEAVEREIKLLNQMKSLADENHDRSSKRGIGSKDQTKKLIDKSAAKTKKGRVNVNELEDYESQFQNGQSIDKDLVYEDFQCNFELLKENTIHILENSHIESSKNILNSLVELLEKEKSSTCSFQQDKKISFMLEMINFYSTPSMLRSLKIAKKSLDSQVTVSTRPEKKVEDVSVLSVKGKEIDDMHVKRNVHSEIEESPKASKLKKRKKSVRDDNSHLDKNVSNVLVNSVDRSSDSSWEERQESAIKSLECSSSLEKESSVTNKKSNQSESSSKKNSDCKKGELTIEAVSLPKVVADFERKKSPAFTHWGVDVKRKGNTNVDHPSGAFGDGCVSTDVSECFPCSSEEVIVEPIQERTSLDLPSDKPSSETETYEYSTSDSSRSLLSENMGDRTPNDNVDILSSIDANNDEYSFIERKLAALDGSVTDSPCIRAELSNNAMSDENISVMFTPSSTHAAEKLPFCFKETVTEKASYNTSKLNSNSLMSFTRLPRTPEKQVEQICQSMLKNKMALVAIPTQSIEHEREQAMVRSNKEKRNKSLLKDRNKHEALGASRTPSEIDVTVSNDETMTSDSDSSADDDDEPQFALSYTELFDLLSLNLSPKKSKDRKSTEGEKSQSNLSQSRIKSTKLSLNKNFQKSSPKKKKDNDKKLEAMESRNPSPTKTTKRTQKNKKSDVTIKNKKNVTAVTNEKKDVTKTLLKTSQPSLNANSSLLSFSRKLDFTGSKRKRSEKESQVGKRNEEKSALKNIPKKSSKQKTSTEVVLPSTSSKPISKVIKENRSKRKPDVEKGVFSTSINPDEETELEELHLSSSDSEEEVEHHLICSSTMPSPSPKKITKSLLEGGTFELSITPSKLQTVISKYPNQDNYFHYNEESMLSIPPTPGKHLILPVPSSSNEPKSVKSGNSYQQSSYSSYGSLYAESGVGNITASDTRRIDAVEAVNKSEKNVVDSALLVPSRRSKRKAVLSPVASTSNTEVAPRAKVTDLASKLKSLFDESTDSSQTLESKKAKKIPKGKTSPNITKLKSSKKTKSPTKSSSTSTEDIKGENAISTLNKKETENLKFLLNLIGIKK